MSNRVGTLYVVATPIGNLGDISERAKHILRTVDLILAEDTRHSRPLLEKLGITTRVQAYHEHNEQQKADQVCDLLQSGAQVALIADAGTPLMSDPGYVLVKRAHDLAVPVSPIPGPMAAISALSVAGLATDRFLFEGFLPAKREARRKRLSELANKSPTLIFYESTHRVVDSLTDMMDLLGPDRMAAYCRELTKLYETVRRDTLLRLKEWVDGDPNQHKGELVIVIEGNRIEQKTDEVTIKVDRLLTTLLSVMPLKQAVEIVTELSGKKRKPIYQRALAIKDDKV